MKTSWYATLAIVASLELGSFVNQSFGDDKGFSLGGRSGGPSVRRSSGSSQFRGGSASSGIAKKVGGSQPLSGKLPGGGLTVKPRLPVVPISGPITKPTLPKLPGGPITKPTLPTLPGGPIVKPTLPTIPIKPPIVKPTLPPIKPFPPIVHPFPPIKPPIHPLPPICPPHCPKPPICPPHFPGGHCGPWYPLPGWWGCHHHCPPIFITLPTFCGAPCVVTETIIVEGATTPVLIDAVVVEDVAEAKLMQVPVGATLTLNDKNLGAEEGQVVLEVQSVSLPAKVNEWKADQVNMTLPMFGLAAPTKAKIWLVRKDGQVANMLMVELIPAAPQAEQASGQQAAVSTQAAQQ